MKEIPKPDFEFAERMGWIKRPANVQPKMPKIRIKPLSTERRTERQRRKRRMLINKRLRYERQGKPTDGLPPRTRRPYRQRCKCCMELFDQTELKGYLCADCINDPARTPSQFGSR